MTNIERYRKEVCINCANNNCTNNIKEIKTQDITIEQISTTTIVRCDDFVCKNKRNPIHQKNTEVEGDGKI